VKDIFDKTAGLSASRVTFKDDQVLADAPTEKNNIGFTDAAKTGISLEVSPKTDAPAGGSGKSAPNTAVFQSHPGEKAVSDKNLLGQIVNKAVLELGKDKSEMKIDIKPENLGAVKIQVVSENQQIHAKITTENLAVKEIIEQNIEQLKQDLTKGGLEVDVVEVEVSVDQERNPGGQESREEYARQLRNMARFRRNDLKLPAHNSDSSGTGAQGNADAGVDYYA
jgi:flagellar hook-length control protein FliK